MRPAVSICIPAYEQPEFLKRAIDSVFEQDFEDFEIIVTDDSKTDAVSNLMTKWQGDSRLIYHRNLVRLGSPGNWNAAMAMARSDLIKMLHHDDWLVKKTSLRSMVEALMKNHEIALVFSNSMICGPDGKFIRTHAPSTTDLALLNQDSRNLQFSNSIGGPSATLFRRPPNFFFDERFAWVVDIDAYIRLMPNQSSFIYLPNELVGTTDGYTERLTSEFLRKSYLRVDEHLRIHLKHPFTSLKRKYQITKFLFEQISSLSIDDLRSLKKMPREMIFQEWVIIQSFCLKKCLGQWRKGNF